MISGIIDKDMFTKGCMVVNSKATDKNVVKNEKRFKNHKVQEKMNRKEKRAKAKKIMM